MQAVTTIGLDIAKSVFQIHGVDAHGKVIVRVDPRYFRPTEVETLLGDPSKAKQKLGWTPDITVQEMCAEMVKTDLSEAKRAALLKSHGYEVNISAE